MQENTKIKILSLFLLFIHFSACYLMGAMFISCRKMGDVVSFSGVILVLLE